MTSWWNLRVKHSTAATYEASKVVKILLDSHKPVLALKIRNKNERRDDLLVLHNSWDFSLFVFLELCDIIKCAWNKPRNFFPRP